MKLRGIAIIGCIALGVFLSACQKTLTLAESNALNAPQVQAASLDAALALGCGDLESYLWDVSYSLVLNPTSGTQNTTFHADNIAQNVLSLIADQHLTAKEKADLGEYLRQFFAIQESILNSTASSQDKLAILTAAELGKSSDPDSKALQDQLHQWRVHFQNILQKDNLVCNKASSPSNPSTPPKTSNPPPLNPAKPIVPTTTALATGARKTMAVAYQSCQLEQLPPINKTTAPASGIQTLGKTPDGAYIRKIVDLPKFLSSQYYYRDFSLKPQCEDVRHEPMIYNYGGKPNVKNNFTAKASSIDLFSLGKNTPGVSPQLGIDCSAYVFTAIATSGLRLSANVALKPILIYGIDASMFLDPHNNGMSCLDKAKMGSTGTLKAGDIIAEPGHVTIIGEVGADPLGLNHISSEAQCDSVSSQNFDFVVYQSSSHKGGIGINKYLGKDYMLEDNNFYQGLIEYAKQACHAKFAGTDVLMQSKKIQVDRFQDSAACKQDSTPLVGESCVNECF